MPNTVLEKEIATLPHAAISEVVDFIRLVKLKFPEEKWGAEKNLFLAFGKMNLFICLRILMSPSKIFRSTCNEVFARYPYNSLVFIR